MPARSMATLTPAATLPTMAGRPMSSGRICSLIAYPTDRRGSSACGARDASTVAKTVACGEMTPSVPPDQTIGICRISLIGLVPLLARTSRKARSARIRV